MPRAKTPRNGNSQKKLGGARPAATKVLEPKVSFANDLEGEIRRRAYEIWEQRGCTPGSEKEDWLVAEQEIVMRREHQNA